MPPVEPGKRHQCLTTYKTRRNQLNYIEHYTDCYLLILKLFSKQLLSWDSDLFFISMTLKLNFNDICLFLFIHMGTIYNSKTVFYCVPERKLSVWTE